MKQITAVNFTAFKEQLLCEEKALPTVEKYVHDVEAFVNWLRTTHNAPSREAMLEYK